MKKSIKTQKLWTAAELSSLAQCVKNRMSHREIAWKLGRTIPSINNAVLKLKHGKIVQSNLGKPVVNTEQPAVKSFKVSVTAKLKSIAFADGQLTFEIES